MKPSESANLPIDFAVLTATEVERDAVCQSFGLSDEHRLKKDGRCYWRSRLPLAIGGYCHIIVANPGDVGLEKSDLPAADIVRQFVSDVIRHWNPATIVLVGIAASSDLERVKLGDVVLGRSTRHCGCASADDCDVRSQSQEILSESWLLKCIAEWDGVVMERPDGATKDRPSVHVGAIDSGKNLFSRLLTIGEMPQRILAVEKYGSGFSQAVVQGLGGIRYWEIRGIYDYQNRKHAKWHQYAITVAAGFARDFLIVLPPECIRPPSMQIEERTERFDVGRLAVSNRIRCDESVTDSVVTGPVAFSNGPFGVITMLDSEHGKLIDREPFTIGRDGHSDFVVPVGKVSRRHAKIERRSGGFFVEDCGSNNGTYVNGIPVGRFMVQHNDVISVANCCLVFETFQTLESANLGLARHVQKHRYNKAKFSRRTPVGVGEPIDVPLVGNNNLIPIIDRLRSVDREPRVLLVQVDRAVDIRNSYGIRALHAVYATVASYMAVCLPSSVILSSALSESAVAAVLTDGQLMVHDLVKAIRSSVPRSVEVDHVEIWFRITVAQIDCQRALDIGKNERVPISAGLVAPSKQDTGRQDSGGSVAYYHSGDIIMSGYKNASNIIGSTVGGVAIDRSHVTGTVNQGAVGSVTQEQHRRTIKEAQAALVQDQDVLDQLDSRLYEALGQFLRIAREIQVEQKSLAEVQTKMKDTLDEVWAHHETKGLRHQVLPRTLELADALVKNPAMTEVVKKLLGA